MSNSKRTLTFVILLEYVNQTLEDLKTFNLALVDDKSDLNLGYFTVEGSHHSIKEFTQFLNGSKF
jgi:hypothetical protein